MFPLLPFRQGALVHPQQLLAFVRRHLEIEPALFDLLADVFRTWESPAWDAGSSAGLGDPIPQCGCAGSNWESHQFQRRIIALGPRRKLRSWEQCLTKSLRHDSATLSAAQKPNGSASESRPSNAKRLACWRPTIILATPPVPPGFGPRSVPKTWRHRRGRRCLCGKLRLGRVSSHRSDVPQDQGPPPARISEPISYIELSRHERKACSRACP